LSFYKPESLNDIAGNKIALQNLGAILVKKELAPKAYIIDGPSGVGKTSVANIFLKHFGTVVTPKLDELDIMDIPECLILENLTDVNNTTAEQIAKLIDSERAYVVITTHNFARLPQVLRTRAFRIQLTLLSDESLQGLLFKVSNEKKIHMDLDGAAQICLRAKGNPGQALTLLHGVSLKSDQVNGGAVRYEPEAYSEIAYKILNSHLADAIKLVQTLDLHPDEIIDQLFTAFSQMFFNDSLPSYLSNYKNVTAIFLKWKSGKNLPLESLPLLLKELRESNMKFVDFSAVANPTDSRARIRPVAPPRELGPSELSYQLGAEIIGEV
jgi:DNA polymerase III gamma/tau subunit